MRPSSDAYDRSGSCYDRAVVAAPDRDRIIGPEALLLAGQHRTHSQGGIRMSRCEPAARAFLVSAVLNAAFFLSPQALAETRKLLVIQDAPALNDVDVGPKG